MTAPYDGRVGGTGAQSNSTDEELAQHRRGLVQAEVPPLDEDGLTVALLGTGAFLLATLVCWLRLNALRSAGYVDWRWICLTGTWLGALGCLYILRRRHKLASKR